MTKKPCIYREKTNHSCTTGFTLIEILIYISLFSIVVGGLLITAYNVISGSGRLHNKVFINEEAAFMIRKFDWALTGATAISVTSSTKLTITKPSLSANPLAFSLSSGTLMLVRGVSSSVQLNSASIKVNSLAFTEIPPSGGRPKGVSIQFELANISEKQNFNITRYLRQ